MSKPTISHIYISGINISVSIDELSPLLNKPISNNRLEKRRINLTMKFNLNEKTVTIISVISENKLESKRCFGKFKGYFMGIFLPNCKPIHQ